MKDGFFLILVLFLFGCSSKEESFIIESQSEEFDWIVSLEEIEDGHPFDLMKDPKFKLPSEITNLRLEDKVAIISFDNEMHVFPYRNTNYFEVINDNIGDKVISFSYCPITESAICFDREKVDNDFLIASGYLYKDNLVFSNLKQDRFWFQMLIKEIKGVDAGSYIETINLVELEWKTVLEYFPNSKVFYHLLNTSSDGGAVFNNNVNENKSVYGIVSRDSDHVKLYSYEHFIESKIYEERINNKKVIIFGDNDKKYITAYSNPNNLRFTINKNNFPNILEDNEASMHLFKKLGFVEIGVKEDWIRVKNTFKNEILLQKINR